MTQAVSRLDSSQTAPLENGTHSANRVMLSFDFRGQVRFESANLFGDSGVIWNGCLHYARAVLNLFRSHWNAAYAGCRSVNHLGYEPRGLIS
jgi:hypothetical protein